MYPVINFRTSSRVQDETPSTADVCNIEDIDRTIRLSFIYQALSRDSGIYLQYLLPELIINCFIFLDCVSIHHDGSVL